MNGSLLYGIGDGYQCRRSRCERLTADDEQDCDNDNIDQNRKKGMDAADPPAAQALHIELFEESNARADKDCVQNTKDYRAALG